MLVKRTRGVKKYIFTYIIRTLQTHQHDGVSCSSRDSHCFHQRIQMNHILHTKMTFRLGSVKKSPEKLGYIIIININTE